MPGLSLTDYDFVVVLVEDYIRLVWNCQGW
jgi:hypothetical protein